MTIKGCVSYSFFRHSASVYEAEKGDASLQFVQFWPLLVRAHRLLWAGWDLIIYHDEHVTTLPYFPKLKRMEAAGLLHLFPMGPATHLCKAMLWRMRPIWNGVHTHVVCRDVDSIPSPRDVLAVDEFIHARMALHVIHDNPAHSGIMGGTLAVDSERFRAKTGLSHSSRWLEMIDGFGGAEWNEHGCDQNFLNSKIFPLVSNDIMLHEFKRTNTALSIAPDRVRRSVEAMPHHIDWPIDVATRGDSVSSGIGICEWPERAFALYNSIDHPDIKLIQECER